MRSVLTGWLAIAWVWAQCGYSGGTCGGLSPDFAIFPPSPRCSYNLPLTVTLVPSGTGSYTVTFRYRLNGTGPWNGISNPGSNQHTFNPGQTGNHQFMMVVTGPGGCLDTVIHCYTITQKPTATLVAVNPASPQCQTSLPLTLNLSAAYGATIVSYAWYLNGTLLGSGPSNNQSFPAAITSPGTYTLKLVVTDTSGCQDSTQQSYAVSAQPTASFTPSATTLCRGGRVCFTNTSTGTGPSTSYFWNFGDGNTSTRPNPCHNYRNPGTYTVSLQVCNPGSCCHTTTQTITVLSGGLADLMGNGAQDTIKYCVFPGDPTTSYTVTFTDGGDCPGGGCTYEWDFGDGTPAGYDPYQCPSDPHLHFFWRVVGLPDGDAPEWLRTPGLGLCGFPTCPGNRCI
ncbi:MAG: hypothetical protein KatS3mg026_0942 [Bacteroidia bacterium]|nr:MAG: hypothetical protein KatS3mg026_0942 [Bacteroidia bacterium]